MKKILSFVFALLFSISCFGQSSTPNLGFQIPATGSNNWYIPLNYNFTKLDLFLSGNLALPGLSVTGNATISGTVTANSFVGLGGAGFATSPGALQYSVPYFFSPGTTSNIGGIALNGIPYFSSTAPPRIATVNDLNVLMRISPGCSTPLYLFSPQSNQCYPATTSYFPGSSTVTVSGAPTTGQVLTATSTSAANWQNGNTSYFPGTSTVTVSSAPTIGQVLTATGTGTANWQNPSGIGSVLLLPTLSQTIAAPSGTFTNFTGILRHDGNAVLDSPFNRQISLGDSITAGAYQINAYAAYPWTIANWLNIVPNNIGVSGATCGSTTTLMFSTSAAGNLPQTSSGIITYQIGTNDANLGGTDANQAANYGTCISAEGAFLAIPTTNKVLASSFATTGTWTTGIYTPSKATTTSGSTATFSVTGSVIYLATVVQATLNTAATATLSCDGTATGATLLFSGNGAEVPINSAFTALTRVSGLTNTTHSCVVTNTGSSGTVELAWAAGLSGSANPTWPYLFQGGIPDQDPAVPSETNLYRAYIPTMVSTLNGDGLNVYFANTNATLTPPNDYVNQLHPIGHGQYLLGVAFINEIKTVTGSKLPTPNWLGNVISDNSLGGSDNMLLGYNTNTTLTGFGNTAIGFNTGNALSTGTENTMLGGATGLLLSTGTQNTIIGYEAGLDLTTGGNNVIIGSNSTTNGSTISNTTAIGANALAKTTVNGNTAVGESAGFINTTVAVTTSSNTSFFGLGSGSSVPSATSISNSGAFGASALVGCTNCYEIGPGTNSGATNTFAFEGYNFLTNAGAATFSSVNASSTITSTAAITGGSFATIGNSALNSSGTATSGGNFSSGTQQFSGSYWNGSTAGADTWQWQNVIGAGTNPTSTLLLTHPTGTSGGSTITVDVPLIATKFGSQNCASSTSPASCGSNSVGSITYPVGATSIVVNTSAVTAISQIFLQPDTSITLSSITCNTTATQFAGPYYVSARTPGTSFTIISLGTTPAVNPACLSFNIVN